MNTTARRFLLFAGLFLSAACVSTATIPAPPAEHPTPTGSPLPTERTAAVWVFFTMAGDENMTPVPAARTVAAADDPTELLRATIRELLKGPAAAERDAGLSSWFSDATADTLAGVVRDGGEFTADFTGWDTLIPNASTSAGSQMLLSQLNSTVFQFDVVQTVRYTLGGDCAAFWEWLQSGCHPVARAEGQAG